MSTDDEGPVPMEKRAYDPDFAIYKKADIAQLRRDLDGAVKLLADIYSGGYTARMITRTAIFLAASNVEFYGPWADPEEA